MSSTAEPLRPSVHDTRMAMARTIALRSLCARDRVGAIITDMTNHIVGEGYNGPPAGFYHGNQPCTIWCKRSSASPQPSPDYSDCPSLHAEANALLMSDRSKRMGGTIYVTSHVCFGCAKLIANSGISTVYVETERTDVHRNPGASYSFLSDCGLDVIVYAPGFLDKGGFYSSMSWDRIIRGENVDKNGSSLGQA